MPSSPLLTPTCISSLLDSTIVDAQLEFIVQVIEVLQSVSSKGYDRCSITISDGEHFTECLLSPQLIPLVQSGVLKKYAVCRVSRIVRSTISDSITVIVNHIVVLEDFGCMIMDPKPFEKGLNKSLVKVSCDTSKLLNSTSEIKSKFIAMHNAKGSDTCDVSKLDDDVCCESCNNKPCDWMEYGPHIISHITTEYVGCSDDSNGNLLEVSGNAVSNKQLRYLAYTAYTSAKHGYLGKRKRIPIPHCVEQGIRFNFPDEDNTYVGYREAQDD